MNENQLNQHIYSVYDVAKDSYGMPFFSNKIEARKSHKRDGAYIGYSLVEYNKLFALCCIGTWQKFNGNLISHSHLYEKGININEKAEK